ncbi:alpha/beta fold hydrolase [Alkalicoccus chagannorensis]|uniref:alpha/beta fold hydrolase n=1 Tax=Alkalicoccus chagannorensis TaxID=427072 RepID=UPI00047BA074|nr:alpha/beta hydrolase [Alkalicoccus chagannorensis]
MGTRYQERNAAQVFGQGGSRVVLAHGFGTDQQVWFEIMPELSSHAEVMTFDYTGAGASDVSSYDPERYHSIKGYADDVLELLDELGWSEVLFVGHSVSGMIAAEAAIQRPELFRKIIMIGPSAHYLNDGNYYGGFDQHEIDELMQMMERNYKQWAQTLAPIAMANPERPELSEDFAERLTRNDALITRQFADVTFKLDMRERVKQLHVPVVILQAMEDIIAPVEAGEYLHQAIPDSSIFYLKGKGHNPHLSSPAEITKHIRHHLV